MSTHHTDVALRFFRALVTDDLDALIASLHPAIVWEVPGRSPAAGRFVGLENVGSMLLRISAMAGGTQRVVAHELFANDDGVVALVEIDITPPHGNAWHGEDAWLIRTDHRHVTSIREHWYDTRGFDELDAWNARTPGEV